MTRDRRRNSPQRTAAPRAAAPRTGQPPRQGRANGPRPGGGRRAGPVQLERERKTLLETGRTRLLVTGLVFACAFAAIGVRVVDVALFGRAPEARQSAQAVADVKPGRRADIVDRNGQILATSLPAPSLYANPQEVLDPERAAQRLSRVLPDLSQERAARLMALDGKFVWLKRGLTPRQQDRINRLGIPGLHFKTEDKRFYPQGRLTAHMIGMADPDGNGTAGIEKSFDDLLSGARRPLKLSLDVRVQHILTDELSRAMTEFQASGAAGVMLDARTGEVVAMVSLPSFDPNAPARASEEARFNRATLGVYEMGSVFKIFTMAGALNRNVVEIADRFDVTDPIRAGGFAIRDYKPKEGELTIPEIFMHSSNIGTAKIAREMGTDRQRDMLAKLGLTTPAKVELPEVGSPMLPSPWRPINTLTISYGHGLAVTPLQLTSAVAATVNGGVLHQPTLLARKDATAPHGRRVFSGDTSQTMRRLMRLTVQYGTGRNADARGYQVGGKTGTADKLDNGRYSDDARIASFVGAFPIDRPKYVIFAMVDEPEGHEGTYGYATGGWVAAPVVRRVVRRAGSFLDITPHAPAPKPELANHPLLREAGATIEDSEVAAE